MESGVNYEPKFARVLIKREVKEKTAGGIFIPETIARRNASCKGVIAAMGETAGWTEGFNEQGERIMIQTMKVGQTVIFGRHAGAWLDATTGKDGENDDGTLYICQDQDILCTVKP